MTRLIAESGRIKQVSKFEAGPVLAFFKKAAISTNGDIGEVTLREGHDNDKYLVLTYPQAVALANEILKRCQ
jgi:hypothetical protein